MLGIFVIAGCVLMTCAGPPISGYSLGTLSGGRGQEYSSGYRTGGFVAMKDSQSDLGDQLGGSGYTTAGSHRHSVTGGSGHSTPGSSYSSDSGYSDDGSSHSNGFGGHLSGGNPDALGSQSSSSYSSNDGTHVSSSELGVGGYTSAASSSGLGGYSTGGSGNGNHVGASFVEYSEGAGSHRPSSVSGLTVSERGPAEYSSPSHPSPSYMSYSLGGPKASAYTSSGSNHRGHGPGSYSSNPSISFMSGGHHGGSASSFYPSESSHSGISSGPSYSSGPSLSSILASMHGSGSSNFIHGSSGHRPSPSHIFAAASNLNPNYSSRGPSSGYYSNSPYPRGGGKIILVKEGSGGHIGHMYPGEQQHNYNSAMFGGASNGYKIRSVASGPSYGPSVGSGYTSSGGYSGGAGHTSSNHGSGGGFFGFL